VLHLNSRLTRWIMDDGHVAGAWADTPGGPRMFRAKAAILTTGGFTADPAMFARMTHGRAQHGAGYRYARGDGLAASFAIGAAAANMDKFLPAFAAVENPATRDGYAFETATDPAVRVPWEVYVDLDGRRFMREDEPVLNLRQRALLGIRDLRFWAIYDARAVRESPSFLARGWSAFDERFDGRWPGYARAGSLSLLADEIGVDPAVLTRTITEYNDTAAREGRPGTIAEPPFHAVRHSGWSPTGFAGLAVDDRLRVVDADHAVIPGLYAAGEVIGMAATAGQSYCSGMSLGPALAFGRLLGQRLGAEFGRSGCRSVT
jgi:fumarate reductase flavoprotein subunit